jgi:acetyltransferase-like isoleucine patch superfamily enzyme
MTDFKNKLTKKIFSKIRKMISLNFYEINQYIKYDPSVIFGQDASINILNPPIDSSICVAIDEESQIMGNLTILRPDAKIRIGKRTQMNGCVLSAHIVEIGDDVLIAGGAIIWDNDSHSVLWKYRMNDVVQCGVDYRENPDNWIKNKNWTNVKMAPVIIENKVWIGFNAAILKGVTIGEGSVVGAMSVITKDVPPYSIVAGNPARVLREIPENER